MKKTIVTAFNESYIKLGSTLIASLIHHNNDIDFIVLDIGISFISKNKLNSWAKTKNVEIKFIKITKKSFLEYFESDVPDKFEFYARLFIPYIIPPHIEVILYLDADIMCLSDFSEIFEINIGENVIASREDITYKRFDSLIISQGATVIPNYKELGIPGESGYFNSGVMLINIKKWKSELISKKVLDLTFKNPKHLFLPDQYGLNISLMNKWFNLDEKWNFMLHQNENPTIVFRHFAKEKPINYKYPYSDKKTFFYYLDLGPWKNWRPINTIFTPKKIISIFRRILKKFKF